MTKQTPPMERREFLCKSAGASMAAWTAVSASRVLGANDRLRVGLDRMRQPRHARCAAHAGHAGGHPGGRTRELPRREPGCAADGTQERGDRRGVRRPRVADDLGQAVGAPGRRGEGLPEGAGRQGNRCRHHRHPGPLARANAHPCVQRGEGRLPREASHVPVARGEGRDRRGPSQQAHRPDRDPAPGSRPHGRSCQNSCRAARSARCASCASGTT